jgi:hypothetical protein
MSFYFNEIPEITASKAYQIEMKLLNHLTFDQQLNPSRLWNWTKSIFSNILKLAFYTFCFLLQLFKVAAVSMVEALDQMVASYRSEERQMLIEQLISFEVRNSFNLLVDENAPGSRNSYS